MENLSNGISRRNFLKMLGAGALFAGLGLSGLQTLNNLGKNNGSKQGNVSYADTNSSWQLGPDTLCTAIHAALLYNGKIFYMAGSDYNPANQNGPYKSGLLDPVSNTQVDIPMSEDLWCSGHAQLADGNILIAGGTLLYIDNSPNAQWHGLDATYEFDVISQSLVKKQSMAHGRWYPTLMSLVGGNVACFSGIDEYGCFNQLVEIYDETTENWSVSYNPQTSIQYCAGGCSTLPGAGTSCYGSANHGVAPRISYYPRMHLMPSGLLALVGMNNVLWTWNPPNGVWVNAGTMSNSGSRTYGTSVLLPLQNDIAEQGKILYAGGAPGQYLPAINTCLIIMPNGSLLTSRFTTSMTYARIYVNSVILPDGKVVVFGGSTSGMAVANAVYYPEMFDPDTESWTVLPPATVPRLYHGVALLLPDGRVWNAGTSYSKTTHELRTEIFSPAYVFATRPSISGDPIMIGGYGGSITIPTPDAANITKVSLLKISTTTHHFNSDQRLVWLQIQNTDSGSVTVKAPINSRIAPPGYYLIHLLDQNSIPSVGKFVKIPSVTLSESTTINDKIDSIKGTKSSNSSLSESVTTKDKIVSTKKSKSSISESITAKDKIVSTKKSKSSISESITISDGKISTKTSRKISLKGSISASDKTVTDKHHHHHG